MSNPNYRSLANHRLKELIEITKEEEDYSLPSVFYSILRKVKRPNDISIGWLRNISDEDFYTAIEQAIKEEQFEQSEANQWT